jgi:hypothetical protein
MQRLYGSLGLVFSILMFCSLQAQPKVGGPLEDSEGLPKVLKMDPVRRTNDVDPMRRTMTLIFDRPMVQNPSMKDLEVSKFLYNDEGFCPRVKGLKWLDDTQCELSVRLCPNQSYSFQLTRKDGTPFFQSAEGEFAPNFRCVFTTGDNGLEDRMLRSYSKLGDAIEQLGDKGEEVDELFQSYEAMSKELEDLMDSYLELKDRKGENKLENSFEGKAFTYDPTNGTVSVSDVWRVKQ